ncbi:MAG: phosphodiester glycosidase family protein [Bacteroidales bacterium]|nr:phosphodiester glycosidase family protein [Bacteroidales bacterium]
MKVVELLAKLRGEKIENWFDLGLFLDRIKEERGYPPIRLPGAYDEFKEVCRSGGVAFLTFHYMVDGVTTEVDKYAALMKRNIPGTPIHYIAGRIHSQTAPFIQNEYRKKIIPELSGFDEWELYKDFFFKKLERGGPAYNELIRKFWIQTLDIVHKLGEYIEEQGISLLYIINVCSNPGNVAYALALVLLSEFLKIPAINNNHDFYWEGGMCLTDREKKGTRPGPRDFFFTNCHLGEVFSIIETLYPWQSRTWMQVNINREQSEHLVKLNGHNPANVMEIGTAVDTTLYTKTDKRKNINTFLQLEKILSRYTESLISYSVEDVLSEGLVSGKNPRPVLIGERTKPVEAFIGENIILLQPTRILSRKRIESSFNLFLKMFQEEDMKLRFRLTSHLKITLLITGPVAAGHFAYFTKLIERFRDLLNEVIPELRQRVYLAFLFGETDRESFKERYENPIGIAELYNISSLVLLPSKTEGRGLPIIEATACGTPIFCRRYEPEQVFSEVIGEHLGERERLKVLEFKGKRISKSMVRKITDRIFFPHRYTDEIRHNQKVVMKRYSLEALNGNLHQILLRLFAQLRQQKTVLRNVKESLDDYREMVSFSDENLEALLDNRNRQYLPGYSKLSFMFMLKSLIDPSFFRIEQQRIRGMSFHFSRAIVTEDPDSEYIPGKIINQFYNAVETLFEYREGSNSIQHDHSMSYRHRNNYHYPYQDFTFQELTGLINLLYIRIVQPVPRNKIDLSPQFFTDWNLALMQLTGSSHLAIDNRKRLIERLRQNRPIAYFPGAYIMYELEFFALQSIRSRLHLPLETMISRQMLEKEAAFLQAVYIFAQEKKLGKQLNKDEITDYIIQGVSEELKLLYEFKVIQIIRTKQVCVGIHFPQLGKEALKVLRKIRDQNGYILTNRSNASMTTDLVDMDRFHIGKVSNEFTAHMMGIPVSSGYIQFVPAGLRSTLSYPAPVQTSKEFDQGMKSELYKELVKELGEERVLANIKEDAVFNGSPLKHVLSGMRGQGSKNKALVYEFFNGLFVDGLPYSGAIARLNLKHSPWDFAAVSSVDQPRSVSQFAEAFCKQSGHQARIAWNGGYILNAELVGKLGLPETYIGAPLGLLISEGIVRSVPLFNKPALLIYKDGSVDIRRVNSSGGFKVFCRGNEIVFSSRDYNRAGNSIRHAYYDLLYPDEMIQGGGRTIIRLSGNEVKEVLQTREGEQVRHIPVGLTLALKPFEIPEDLQAGEFMDLKIPGMEEVMHAVEAGPMLLDRGSCVIDMELEGWNSNNSIRTQAARLDYTNMRGPKIAVGINRKHELAVLTINGRIRESVGATHHDMAEILLKHGMEKAMGFDPGGSSTLVVGTDTLNISPYNSEYEQDVYALPPEPRAVSNAIIGFIRE